MNLINFRFLRSRANPVLCLITVGCFSISVAAQVVDEVVDPEEIEELLPEAREITKSTILFTQVPDATPDMIDAYRATGVFWGHMPGRRIDLDENILNWAENVKELRLMGLDFIGRSEFDWGWAWFIDFEDDPEPHWVKNLADQVVRYEFMGYLTYEGVTNNWVSHHSPRFKDFLKFQIDRLFEGEVTHVMFDSQTSATRAVHWFGGDFSPYAMSGFRDYLAAKYTVDELSELGVYDIDNFDYRELLLSRGYNIWSYLREARTISGRIPFYEDFVYFNREALNTVMDEVFEYVDRKSPGIAIGATTSLIESRGFLFSERLTYIAGEMFMETNRANVTPYKPILNYKAAESLGKDYVYFPYPSEFATLVNRNTPRQARTWIAQSYAMGAIFTIPGNVWVGGDMQVWQAPSHLYSDLYRFIDDHGELFDDYEALSRVGYVYPVLAALDSPGMEGTPNAQQSIAFLIDENIPFEMLLFGDPNNPIVPEIDDIEALDLLFIDEDVRYLNEDHIPLLEGENTHVVSYVDRDLLMTQQLDKVDVYVSGELHNELITALPRVSISQSAPYVLHLVNRIYQPTVDDVMHHGDVMIKISQSLFPEKIIGAILHSPGQPSRHLDIRHDPYENVFLDIGNFELWNIIELEHIVPETTPPESEEF